MANAYEQIDMIAAEALMLMTDAMAIIPLTTTDKTSDFMTRPNGYSVGDTVRIKQRPDYEAKEFTAGGNITIQDIRESKRSMTIEKHFDVSVELGAKEKVLDFESFSDQVIRPAAMRLAEKADKYVGGKIIQGAGLFYDASLYQSAASVANSRKAATIQQLDPSGRYCLVDLDLEATILGQTWFNQSQTRGSDGEDTLRTGLMGRVMGMDFYSSINFGTSAGNTIGNGAGTTDNTVATNNIVGNTALVFDGGTGTFNVGDRIQIAGVSRPLIVATQTTGVSGSIPLVDPITEIIPDNAAITTIASGQTIDYNGAIFDSQAMAVAMPLLDPASSAPSAVISEDGVSIRVVTGYDMTTKKETISLDMLIGATAYDPRRITLLAQ